MALIGWEEQRAVADPLLAPPPVPEQPVIGGSMQLLLFEAGQSGIDVNVRGGLLFLTCSSPSAASPVSSSFEPERADWFKTC